MTTICTGPKYNSYYQAKIGGGYAFVTERTDRTWVVHHSGCSSNFENEFRTVKWVFAHTLAVSIVAPCALGTMSSFKTAFITAISVIGCLDVLSFLYFFSPDRPKPSLNTCSLVPNRQDLSSDVSAGPKQGSAAQRKNPSANLGSRTLDEFKSTPIVKKMQSKPEKITIEPIFLSLKFRDLFFNVELTPRFNGKAFNPTDKMREVERQKKVYTKMIEEIVKIHEPDYTKSLGLLKGLTDKGFIFENGILPLGYKTRSLWKQFLYKLGHPEKT